MNTKHLIVAISQWYYVYLFFSFFTLLDVFQIFYHKRIPFIIFKTQKLYYQA